MSVENRSTTSGGRQDAAMPDNADHYPNLDAEFSEYLRARRVASLARPPRARPARYTTGPRKEGHIHLAA